MEKRREKRRVMRRGETVAAVMEVCVMTYIFCLIHICPLLHQQLYHFDTTAGRSDVERCLAFPLNGQ